MPERIIIVDSRRANTEIPAYEMLQMAGRVARGYGGECGVVDVVVPDSDLSRVKEIFSNHSKERVYSVLVSDIEFHLIAEIYSGNVRDEAGAKNWYKRTLSAAQGIAIDISEVLDSLRQQAVIDGFQITRLGEACGKFYLDPKDVCGWRENFSKLFLRGAEGDTAALAWALGRVPMGSYPGGSWRAGYALKDALSGFDLPEEYILQCSVWYGLLGGPSPKPLAGEMAAMRKNFSRFCGALKHIDTWGMSRFFDRLAVRVERRVPDEIVDLFEIPDINRSEAMELAHMDIMSPDRMLENPEWVLESVSENLKHKIARWMEQNEAQ
jgi:hypothetical protein